MSRPYAEADDCATRCVSLFCKWAAYPKAGITDHVMPGTQARRRQRERQAQSTLAPSVLAGSCAATCGVEAETVNDGPQSPRFCVGYKDLPQYRWRLP